ncbi:MAG: methyltransferase [Myxococcota bacterium]
MHFKPAPYNGPSPKPIGKNSNFDHALKQLIGGMTLCVTDRYRTGIELLNKLDAHLGPPPNQRSHVALRKFNQHRRKLASRLLVPIRNHQAAIKDVPKNGFYEILYPKQKDMWLPFPVIQELHSAWNDFNTGVHFNVLGHRIHPFYGTYCPTRTEHLELFATWLSQYNGQKKTAIDVGTGSGILALLLQRSGFEQITACDLNPNAIESLRRELERHKKPENITLKCQDLMEKTKTKYELIVFNPPWLRGKIDSLIDKGMYYTDNLFDRFFEQSHQALQPDGRIALIYSNIQSLVQPNEPHPILTELEKGRFQLVQKMQRRLKPKRGFKRTKEKCEIWELSRRS